MDRIEFYDHEAGVWHAGVVLAYDPDIDRYVLAYDDPDGIHDRTARVEGWCVREIEGA